METITKMVTLESTITFLSHPYWTYALFVMIPIMIYVIYKQNRQPLGLKKWI